MYQLLMYVRFINNSNFWLNLKEVANTVHAIVTKPITLNIHTCCLFNLSFYVKLSSR